MRGSTMVSVMMATVMTLLGASAARAQTGPTGATVTAPGARAAEAAEADTPVPANDVPDTSEIGADADQTETPAGAGAEAAADGDADRPWWLPDPDRPRPVRQLTDDERPPRRRPLSYVSPRRNQRNHQEPWIAVTVIGALAIGGSAITFGVMAAEGGSSSGGSSSLPSFGGGRDTWTALAVGAGLGLIGVVTLVVGLVGLASSSRRPSGSGARGSVAALLVSSSEPLRF